MKKQKIVLLTLLPLLLLGCRNSEKGNLVHLQIVDRNGYTKTINDREKMQTYEVADLKASSSHEKIVRVFDKNKQGIITAYHDNGLLWQYLETKANRACGVYEEYHSNGKISLQGQVIEGIADLTDEAKTSWIFEGECLVFDINGKLEAKIPYVSGLQQGIAQYFYSDGSLKKKVPFTNNKIHGQVRGYDKKGNLVLMSNYLEGQKEGEAFFNGSSEEGAYEEVYRNGRLVHGKYFDLDGKLFSEIENSSGIKPIFAKGLLIQTEEYKSGVKEGMITKFRKDRTVESKYSIKDNRKDGEEIIYYPANLGVEPIKKLMVTWREGLIHGKVNTWYANGVLESEKEMCDHKKEGTLISWYMDSSLMLVEEYRNDKLVNGKYLRKGDNVPISRVIDGIGDAHIYDKDGILLRKVAYYNGNPVE
ncbi:MAG: hypothetical protein S4CHLAM20_05470 [Chlamydiia bacterium]|nr:hypothetical protein [Chlamydiia bacterium]